MNDIIESQLESAVSIIIAALISFVFENLLLVLFIVVVIVCVVAFMKLNSMHRNTAHMLQRANQLQQDISTRMSKVLVSDTFKELELGLAQGETERGLQHMEKAAYNLHQQSEQLAMKLKQYRSTYFAPIQSFHQVEDLELEAVDLHERVERYLSDLTGIEQSTRNTGKHLRQLKDRLNVVGELINHLGEKSGFSLVELRQRQRQVEEAFEKTDQLAAFDAIQAKSELTKLGRLIDELKGRTEQLQKNLTIMEQIRTRIQKQEELLLQRLEQEQFNNNQTPLQLFQTINPILEQLDAALRAGEEVNLRAAAQEIEHILQQVFS